MPGSVPAATVVDSFPAGYLYASYTEGRSWPVQANDYAGGEHQAAAQAATPRRGPWQIVCRCAPANVATLRTFYENHLIAPFYFTPLEGTPRAVRFASGWQQSSQPGQVEITLTWIEIA